MNGEGKRNGERKPLHQDLTWTAWKTVEPGSLLLRLIGHLTSSWELYIVATAVPGDRTGHVRRRDE